MDINRYHQLADAALEGLQDQFEVIVDDHARGDDFDVGYSVRLPHSQNNPTLIPSPPTTV